jgi:hypothetical protein
VGIVESPLVLIVEDLVCLFRGLESDLGFGSFVLGNFVGVVGEGGLGRS